MLRDNDFKDISTSASENENDDSSSNFNVSNDFEIHLTNKDKSKRRRLIEETEQNRYRKVTPIAKFNQEFMEALKNIEKINRKSKLDVKPESLGSVVASEECVRAAEEEDASAAATNAPTAEDAAEGDSRASKPIQCGQRYPVGVS
ncbi:hypothetical protein CBL_20329 [Carabus blaptoides fortunei]